MKTAEQFYYDAFIGLNIEDNEALIPKIMVEFAKMHVEAALKEALKEVPYGGSDPVYYEDVEGILTCYPLENIK